MLFIDKSISKYLVIISEILVHSGGSWDLDIFDLVNMRWLDITTKLKFNQTVSRDDRKMVILKNYDIHFVFLNVFGSHFCFNLHEILDEL